MRCPICGHIGGHSRLTHRNQMLLEWWPLYKINYSRGIVPARSADKVPEWIRRMVDEDLEKTLGDCEEGVM